MPVRLRMIGGKTLQNNLNPDVSNVTKNILKAKFISLPLVLLYQLLDNFTKDYVLPLELRNT